METVKARVTAMVAARVHPSALPKTKPELSATKMHKKHK
jgi:hypothetical protein